MIDSGSNKFLRYEERPTTISNVAFIKEPSEMFLTVYAHT